MADQRITLTIISSTAGELVDEYNIHLKIQAVKTSAMAKLKLDPSMADQYHLIYNGEALPEGDTLEALGIPDGAELLLEPKAPEVI